MKKTNLITFSVFLLLIVGVMIFMEVKEGRVTASGTQDISSGKEEPDSQETGMASELEEADSQENESASEKKEPDSQEKLPEKEQESKPSGNNTGQPEEIPADITEISMADALFIGDSRTVGLMEYAGLTQADFFANVGMSVFNIYDKTVAVPKMGKVTLTELITNKKYGKIYIMLGINELGYRLEDILAGYEKLLKFVADKQPEAVIFIQANLHVTGERSQKDATINNAAIDRLNQELASFADNKHTFFMDANALFDDEEGNLAKEKSEDMTHLYARYYAEWGRWILAHTASDMEGEDH